MSLAIRCVPSLAITAMLCGLVGCSSSPPASDDDVLKHVLAINTCYAKMYMKQANATFNQLKTYAASPDLTPGPTPSLDDQGLRLCYVATLPNQTLNGKIRMRPAILALGRSCEHLIDTQSDSAMGAYNKCIQDGIPAALKGKGS